MSETPIVPSPPPPPPPPPTTHITLHQISKANVHTLKQINSAVLQSSYSPQWYKSTLTAGELAVMAYYHHNPVPATPRRAALALQTLQPQPQPQSQSQSLLQTSHEPELPKLGDAIPCGAIRAVLDPPSPPHLPPAPPSPSIYIMTIAVLAPFRHQGVGSALLQHIVAEAKYRRARCVYLHVHTHAHDTVRWYKARGFDLPEKGPQVVEKYYAKMNPQAMLISWSGC